MKNIKLNVSKSSYVNKIKYRLVTVNKIIITLLLLFSSVSYAGSIGFGKVVGIKQYDFSSNNTIKIFLHPDAALSNESCIEKQRVYGVITPSKHDANVIDRMLSLLMTAYVADRKIRLHSESNSCEIDFVSLQEDVF